MRNIRDMYSLINSGNFKDGYHFECMDIDTGILLKLILKICENVDWIGSNRRPYR
jgi:hypothetical protein